MVRGWRGIPSGRRVPHCSNRFAARSNLFLSSIRRLSALRNDAIVTANCNPIHRAIYEILHSDELPILAANQWHSIGCPLLCLFATKGQHVDRDGLSRAQVSVHNNYFVDSGFQGLFLCNPCFGMGTLFPKSLSMVPAV